MFSRDSIVALLKRWKDCWNNHDLPGVMELFHENILFENWNGAIILGKETLKNAWKPWFDDHGDFALIEEETFIDEAHQKVLFRWTLEWNSLESGYLGKRERRRGLDILHFREGKIIRKYTYSKTMLEIEGKTLMLVPESSRGD
jgi:hypothetical protein